MTKRIRRQKPQQFNMREDGPEGDEVMADVVENLRLIRCGCHELLMEAELLE